MTKRRRTSEATGGDAGEAALERGMALHRQGRFADALIAYDRHLAVAPGDAQALFLAGTARFQMRDLAAAEALLTRAAALAPDMAEAHSNLGLVRVARGLPDAAEASFRRALAVRPAFAEAHNNLGEVLWRAGRRQEAMAAYRQAVDIAPRLPAAQNNLGMALRDAGDTAAAESAFRAALAADPAFGDSHSNLCSLLLELRRPAAALMACDAYLSHHPGHSGALSFRVAALLQAGDVDAAEKLTSFDALFRADLIDPPAGYADVRAFNAALAEQVLGDPSLLHRPEGVATRLGLHTGNLADGRGGPAGVLEALVRQVAERYARTLVLPADHPFRRSPDVAVGRVDIWSVVMNRGGHELPHLHPQAWLSGVYYARVPASVISAGSGGSGWIGFGRPPDIYPLPQAAAIRWIRPEEGKMILFPSYFFHETVPLSGDDVRISLAFDVFSGPA